MPPDVRNAPAADGGAPKSRRGGPDSRSLRPPCDTGEQPTFDDVLEEGRRRRDDGLRVATYSTDVAWVRAADQAIRDLAAGGAPFTAEEVRRRVGPPIGSPNAMGSRFMAAARKGVIRRHGTRQSERREAAGRWLTVWIGVGG